MEKKKSFEVEKSVTLFDVKRNKHLLVDEQKSVYVFPTVEEARWHFENLCREMEETTAGQSHYNLAQNNWRRFKYWRGEGPDTEIVVELTIKEEDHG